MRVIPDTLCATQRSTPAPPDAQLSGKCRLCSWLFQTAFRDVAFVQPTDHSASEFGSSCWGTSHGLGNKPLKGDDCPLMSSPELKLEEAVLVDACLQVVAQMRLNVRKHHVKGH